MSVVPLDELGQCLTSVQVQAACAAAIAAAGLPTAAQISAVLTPTDLVHVPAAAVGSIIVAGVPGEKIEVWAYTASAAGLDGAYYTLGWSDNDTSNFVAWTPYRQAGALVDATLYVGSETQPRSVGQPIFTAPAGKAFAATFEGVFDLEYSYRFVPA